MNQNENMVHMEHEEDSKSAAILGTEEAESESVYQHTLKKPVSYNNQSIQTLTFDWDSLTGRDSLDIEAEMQGLGKMLSVPVFSGEYLIRMAARASSPRVGSDFFAMLPLSDYNKIRSAARSFLLKSE